MSNDPTNLAKDYIFKITPRCHDGAAAARGIQADASPPQRKEQPMFLGYFYEEKLKLSAEDQVKETIIEWENKFGADFTSGDQKPVVLINTADANLLNEAQVFPDIIEIRATSFLPRGTVYVGYEDPESTP